MISDYAELQEAVANWLGKSDFAERIPEMIAFAESRLNAELPVSAAETSANLTGTVDSRSLALPADFLEPIALFLTTFGAQDKLAPIISGNYELKTVAGSPQAWMISGGNIDLDKPCDKAHTFLFQYRKKLFDLANTSTNWLLTNHPNVYLFATLVEAFSLEDPELKLPLYQARLRDAISRVRWLEARSKSIAPLRVDPAITGRGGFNIIRGD